MGHKELHIIFYILVDGTNSVIIKSVLFKLFKMESPRVLHQISRRRHRGPLNKFKFKNPG